MNIPEAGSSVICGICHRETTVSFTSERVGGPAFDLACWHRNAICPKCGTLVRDASEVIQEVHPHCNNCDGPWDEGDD